MILKIFGRKWMGSYLLSYCMYIHGAYSCVAAAELNQLESPCNNVKKHIEKLRSGPIQIADKSENEDVTKMYMQARLLMQQGNTAAAVPLLEKCCQLDPAYISAWTSYGIALQTIGRSKEAVLAFKKVLDLEPKRASYWSNLANAYLVEQDFEQSADAFKQALSLDSTLPQVHEAYGFVLMKLNKDKQAKEELLEAIKLNPEAANAWNLLGDVYLRLNQSKEARDAYAECLRLNPNTSDARAISSKLKKLGKASSKAADPLPEKTKVDTGH